MGEHWIDASTARELAGGNLAICERLHAGLIASRARLFTVSGTRHENVALPTQFWWAKGHEALEQNWRTSDFSTWIDNRDHWQAFGVTFALSGVLDMLPFERRGVLARSLSVAGNSEWVSAQEARRFAYEKLGFNPVVAGGVLTKQASLGFLVARAVTAQGSKGGADEHDGWAWDEREWNVAPWFWENFLDEGRSAQDWETGKFSGRGIGPIGLRWVTLNGVHFLRESLIALLPTSDAPPVPTTAAKNVGGRPPAAFSDEMMCAIWALIYQGDLQPKTQADVEKAMLDWTSERGHELGTTLARQKARLVMTAISKEVANPAG